MDRANDWSILIYSVHVDGLHVDCNVSIGRLCLCCEDAECEVVTSPYSVIHIANQSANPTDDFSQQIKKVPNDSRVYRIVESV